MDASGNLSANGMADSELAEPRGPGRPKGGSKPPGSGRQKGTPNRVTREVRDIASKYTQRAVKQAWALATAAKNQDTQLKALELILAYGHGRPSQTTLVGGVDDPVRLQVQREIEGDDRELARRICTLLYASSPDYRAARDAERVTRHAEARDEFAEAVQAPQNGADAQDTAEASSPTPPPTAKLLQSHLRATSRPLRHLPLPTKASGSTGSR